MIDRLSPSARKVALVALFILVGWFLWSVRSVLNPLILGYLLAFVVHPLVLRLERKGWKRRRAVNFIFGAFAVLLTLIGLGIFFQGRGLARELASEVRLHVVSRRPCPLPASRPASSPLKNVRSTGTSPFCHSCPPAARFHSSGNPRFACRERTSR